MSAVTEEEQVFVKEGILAEGVPLDIKVAGNSLNIKGLEGHAVQFPIQAAAGKQMRVFVRIVVEDAPPVP